MLFHVHIFMDVNVCHQHELYVSRPSCASEVSAVHKFFLLLDGCFRQTGVCSFSSHITNDKG